MSKTYQSYAQPENKPLFNYPPGPPKPPLGMALGYGTNINTSQVDFGQRTFMPPPPNAGIPPIGQTLMGTMPPPPIPRQGVPKAQTDTPGSAPKLGKQFRIFRMPSHFFLKIGKTKIAI